MSATDLQAVFETAQAHAHQLQADRDAARDQYTHALRDANAAAAVAHKAWRDALALEGLEGREDAAEVAARLGLG